MNRNLASVVTVGAFLVLAAGSSEADFEGQAVLTIDGKPIALATSKAACDVEKDLEWPVKGTAECVPAGSFEDLPARGVAMIRTSARSGSTVSSSETRIRYFPGFYSMDRCAARAALLTAERAESVGVQNRYACSEVK